MDDTRAHLGGGLVHEGILILHTTGVLYDAPETGVSVVCEVVDRVSDVAGRVKGHHLPGCDDEDIPGIPVPDGHGEPAAHNIPEDVVDYDVGTVAVDDIQLLELLESGDDPASGAPDPGFGSSALHAEHPVLAHVDHVLEFRIGIVAHRFQNGGDPAPCQKLGGIGLGIASDLHDLQTAVRQGRGYVCRCGRLPYSALAVDSDPSHGHFECQLLINTFRFNRNTQDV